MTTPYKVTFYIIDEKKILSSNDELGELILKIPGLVSLEDSDPLAKSAMSNFIKGISTFYLTRISDTQFDCAIRLAHPTDYNLMLELFNKKGLSFKEKEEEIFYGA